MDRLSTQGIGLRPQPRAGLCRPVGPVVGRRGGQPGGERVKDASLDGLVLCGRDHGEAGSRIVTGRLRK